MRSMKWIVAILAMMFATVLTETEKDVNTTEFVSCFCDMTDGICDIYCCCDQDCAEFQKMSFHCRDKEQQTDHSQWRCGSDTSALHGGLFHLLCIEKENNPYLGLFYRNLPVIKDIPSINDLLEKKKKNDRHAVTSKSVLNSASNMIYLKNSGNERGYIFGQELNIIAKNLQTALLYVPYNIYSSKCDILHPIQYLKDMTSTCLLSAKDYCLSKQVDVQSFLIGSSSRQLLGAAGDEIPLKNIFVNYFSPKELCCYLRANACLAHYCKENDWNPYSYAKPESPHLENGICHNSILEVKYLFWWQSNRIRSVNLTIVIGDVPAKAGNFISQKFTVVFRHVTNRSHEFNTLNIPRRSNLLLSLGYEMQDPIIGVHGIIMEVESDISEINRSLTTNFLHTWKNDASGRCSVDPRPVAFGVDRFSGCYFEVQDWASLDCQQLREDVLNQQSKILMSEFLSRGRNSTSGNYVKIISRDVSYENSSEEEKNESQITGQRMCFNVPEHIHLEVTYEEIFRTMRSPIYTIVAAVRSYSTSTWRSPVRRTISLHPLFSSVKFRYFSTKEEERRRRALRSELPILKPWERKEGCNWRDALYPFVDLEFPEYHTLGPAIDTVFLVVIFLSSAGFLIQMKRSSRTVERP